MGKELYLQFKKKRSKKTKCAFVLVLFVMAQFFSASSFYINKTEASTTGEIQQQISGIDQQINQISADLKIKKAEGIALQDQVNVFDSQIYLLQLQIQKTNAEINQTQTEINNTLDQIKKAEDEIARQKDLLGENLRVFYEEAQVSSIEVVASSDNFSEYINKTEYLKSLQDNIVESVDKINALKVELDNKKKDLETKKTQHLTLKNQLDAQEGSLSTQRNARAGVLDAVNTEIKGTNSKLKELYNLKTALSAQFNEKVYGGGSGGGGYPWGSPANPQDANDGNGYLTGECTSWAAWRRKTTGNPVGTNWGNANQWDNGAIAAGYAVDSIPTVGSVMVFPNIAPYGHVAYVEAVYSNTSILISEYNWIPYSYQERVINPLNYSGIFIH